MLASTRRESILAEVRSAGEVSVSRLAGRFGVSAATIRRDLNTLGKEGQLLRVRGGGSYDGDDRPFGVVATDQADVKDRLGARAATLVHDRDVVILDIGTTVAQVARHLRGRRLTVVTASLAVVDVLRDDPRTELVVLGGVLRHSYLSLVGALPEHALSQIAADVCFLGASGVRDDGSPMDSTSIEVPVKNAILDSSARRVLVVDESKFPGSGLLAFCGPDRLDAVVTTAAAHSPGLDQLRAYDTEIITA